LFDRTRLALSTGRASQIISEADWTRASGGQRTLA